MTNERAAKIVLDLINAGEAEYRNFSVEEIIAFKKAYVALNPEPITNADRIRCMSDEELEAEFWRIYEELRRWTNSRIWLHQWLMEEVKE